MDSLEESYYEWDGFWEPEQFTSGAQAARIAATVAVIPPGVRTVADIGSGTGEFGRRLLAARPELSVCSVDRSKAALARVTTDKVLGSIDAIPLASRSKDLVACLQVLEHLPKPIYTRALAELARVADRYLLISVPFEEDLATNHTTCPECASVFNADLHLRSYDRASFSTLFSGNGFELRKTATAGPQEQVVGMLTYERVRALVAPRAKVFLAPSCPICGYRRAPNPEAPPRACTSFGRARPEVPHRPPYAEAEARRLLDHRLVRARPHADPMIRGSTGSGR